MSFAQLRVRQIKAKQRQEIERLSTDRAYAARRARHPAYARIGDWLPPGRGGRVLDVGCGPGRYVALLAALGYDVVGVDPHSFPEWELIRAHHNVEFLSPVFAEQLPFAADTFDDIVCLGALLYFDDPAGALRELHRVVKDGARVVVRTVNSGNLYTRRTRKKLDPASKSLYTMDELVGLLEANSFRVARSFAFGFWPPAGTDTYWYLQSVLLPLPVQTALSSALPPLRRVNNVVFATAA